MEQKDFVGGKCELKTFPNGGQIYKIWIPKDEVMRILKDTGINFEIKFSREGNKPYMENNTWQPRGQQSTPPDSQGMGYQNEPYNPYP